MQQLQPLNFLQKAGLYAAVVLTLAVIISLCVVVTVAGFVHQIFVFGLISLIMLPIGAVYYVFKGYVKMREYVIGY